MNHASPRVLAILQARTSSSRLPGKVLKPILGQPMLARQIERVRRTRLVDHLIVATSIEASDDPLERLCQELGVPCFRGSLTDVLDRFYQAAQAYQPLHVARLTGDCPLSEPAVIDAVIDFHLANAFDYSSNALEQTYPDGLDVEVFRLECLAQAWAEAKLPSEREHVTPFIHKQPDRFRIGKYKSALDLSAHRWTVDTAQDFELVTKIYEALYPSNPQFNMQDILALLECEPALKAINADQIRNEGYLKSLAQDAKTGLAS